MQIECVKFQEKKNWQLRISILFIPVTWLLISVHPYVGILYVRSVSSFPSLTLQVLQQVSSKGHRWRRKNNYGTKIIKHVHKSIHHIYNIYLSINLSL